MLDIMKECAIDCKFNKSYNISQNVLFSGFGPTLARNTLFAAMLNYTVNKLQFYKKLNFKNNIM